MGAYKYVNELWRKKQSDVMRYLLRLRCWEYRQRTAIHSAPRPSRPEKAHRLGYKHKRGYVIFRVRVRRGCRNKLVHKGQIYGKPASQGVSQLKHKRSCRARAEQRVGRKIGTLRVLNSYWVNQDSTFKYFEIIMVDPFLKSIRNDPKINWICNAVHKRREARGLTAAGHKHRGLGKHYTKHNATKGGSQKKNWKRRNTLSLRRYRK
eukprot:TRINITY_DN44434_c0_g1_i1.p1 TRINITY_DN44434_c0_g1~~TRINITY_DN44434_c0_g1_i1.p1  ORF type:complete len:215 (-),score=-7.68 TRINITY_DN44434_c0_g1_i1:96-716(-)